MFDAISDAIAGVLAFFYSLPVVGGSYGVAIVLLTLAVMVVLMPLTIRATQSTIKMQAMQPKLKELQKKHKDDRQTLNAELMELYREQGINPVGGCLPMIAQLPVFLVLFNVLRGLSRRVSEAPYYSISEEARAAAGRAPIDPATFEPQYLSNDSEMYQALIHDTEMDFLGIFDLALDARDVIQDNILRGIPYVLLILFVVGTSYYQQRQVSSRRGTSTGMNPQQEMILRILPLASGIWSFVFPAGLVLYWATSNVFRIGQQYYITRAFYADEDDGSDTKSSPLQSADDDSSDDDVSPSTADDTADDDADRARSTKRAASGGRSGSASSSGGNRKKKDDSGRSGAAASSSNSKSKSGSVNGTSSSNGASDGASRQEQWAKRREQRAKAKTGTRSRPAQSSRVTPKGTKPGGSKKKRKR